MKQQLRNLFVGAVISVLLPTLVSADVLFSNLPNLEDGEGVSLGSNGPDYPSSEGAAGQQIAEPFTLPFDAVLENFTWYGTYTDESSPPLPVAFKLRIFGNDSEFPGSILYEQVFSAVAQVSGVKDAFDRPILSYSHPIDDFAVPADTTYWVSILENDSSTISTWGWRDAIGDFPPPPPFLTATYVFRNNETDTWGNASFPLASRAFILAGTIVPEPSAVLMLCAGLVGLVTRRKR